MGSTPAKGSSNKINNATATILALKSLRKVNGDQAKTEKPLSNKENDQKDIPEKSIKSKKDQHESK